MPGKPTVELILLDGQKKEAKIKSLVKLNYSELRPIRLDEPFKEADLTIGTEIWLETDRKSQGKRPWWKFWKR